MITAPYKLSPGGVVTLFEIDFSQCLMFTATGTTTMYFSPYRNGELDIVYNAHAYRYIGAEVKGLRAEINTSAPTPILTLDKASLYSDSTFISIRDQYQTQTGQQFFDWRGARVKIIKYYVVGSETLYEQEYIVDQVTTITKSDVQVQLTVSLGIDALGSNSVQTLSLNRCSLKYRQWNPVTSTFDYIADNANGCPYGNPGTPTNYSAVPSFGIKYFTAEDVELLAANKQYDECSLTVKGCQLRFDPNNEGLNLPIKANLSPQSKIG